MRIPMYQVDAFADHLFGGNPAAVCLLENWADDPLLQAIAAENNPTETAFVVRQGDVFAIRWFANEKELDLSGHATLASAHVVLRHLRPGLSSVVFRSQSGDLAVSRDGQHLSMLLPRRKAEACPLPIEVLRGLGVEPRETYKARDYLAVYATEEEVRGLRPDFRALGGIDALGVIATAPAKDYDFVSRFFAPRAGINEDAATGSAHCTLAPYWAERLGKKKLRGRQISKRGGEVYCEDRRNEVVIAGRTVEFFSGTIEV
jgi:predicted PhzF superfamily epimerase YddE/YHI9